MINKHILQKKKIEKRDVKLHPVWPDLAELCQLMKKIIWCNFESTLWNSKILTFGKFFIPWVIFWAPIGYTGGITRWVTQPTATDWVKIGCTYNVSTHENVTYSIKVNTKGIFPSLWNVFLKKLCTCDSIVQSWDHSKVLYHLFVDTKMAIFEVPVKVMIFRYVSL